MTLDEARAAFEALFDEVIAGPPCAYVAGSTPETTPPEGHCPYVVITSGGVKLEGAPDEWSGSTVPEKAVAEWLRHAKAYARVSEGKFLYYRIAPELGADDGGKLFKVYSRLFISARKFADGELSIHPGVKAA